ncbi:MAG: hypothetical protein PVI90_11570 [Desulfobacteraceae bacterium]
MNKVQEKRECERYPHQAAVRFAYFNHKTSYPAKLLGFSQGGISFYSKTPIKAGTTILIKMEQLSNDTFKEMGLKGLKTISLVETRWCREIGGPYASEYEIGAKFFMCD